MRFIEAIERYSPAGEQERQDARMMRRYAEIFPDVLSRTNETAHFTAMRTDRTIRSPSRSRRHGRKRALRTFARRARNCFRSKFSP